MKTEVATPARQTASVLGFPVDLLTMESALATIEEFIAEGGSHVVVTADAAGLVTATQDEEHAEVLRSADLVTADSVGVLWAGKRAGHPFPHRVSGVDLAEKLIARSADKGYRVYFLGAAPGVAEQAAEKMRLKFPGCNIVGARHGFFPAESDSVVAVEVAEFKPDVLLVAMGIPRQEKFIAKTREIIKAKVAIGVGGTFDVLSGNIKRAPKVIQKLKLEWLWRLIKDPKKIKKTSALPRFVWRVLRHKP